MPTAKRMTLTLDLFVDEDPRPMPGWDLEKWLPLMTAVRELLGLEQTLSLAGARLDETPEPVPFVAVQQPCMACCAKAGHVPPPPPPEYFDPPLSPSPVVPGP